MRAVVAISFLIGTLWAAPAAHAQEEPAASEPGAAQQTAEAEQAMPSEPVAPPPQPKSLDELVEMVRTGFAAEREENKRREQEFLEAKGDQARLLAEALATLEREEALSQRLENTYNENEPRIAASQAQLSERLGQLGELFGVVRQISTDLSGQIWDSLTSSELGPRKELLDRLGRTNRARSRVSRRRCSPPRAIRPSARSSARGRSARSRGGGICCGTRASSSSTS
jgi:hypothetical protein